MDDTCTALPRDLVDPFHEHLNSINPHIQFTVERESRGHLPFLDVLLSKEEDGTISTEVYQKPTHMDQYLAFDSHHPTAHKRAVVRTLMSRAETLSSSGVSRVQDEKRTPKECTVFPGMSVRSRAYIGQTGRSLDHHIAEHWWAFGNGDVAASALAEHVFTAGH